MAPQHPRISVGHTGSCKPTLIAGIGQLARVGAQHVHTPVETADVILSAMHMRTHKMAGKPIAEPIPDFGL